MKDRKAAGKLRRYLLFLGVLIIVVNTEHTVRTIRYFFDNMPSAIRLNPPGQQIAPLKPYLHNISFVGYCTDRYSKHFWFEPPTAGRYQSFQYALSPIQLDIEHCEQYDHVIFDCRERGCHIPYLKKWHGSVMHDIDGKIVLIRKGRPQ
jgi:hypothetical protein